MGSSNRQYPLVILLLLILFGSPAAGEVLTLDDCIEMALKTNQTVIRARNRTNNANGTVWAAFGAFLPSLTVSGSASRVMVDVTDALPPQLAEAGGVSKNYSISASGNMTLFNGGRNYFNYMGARADLRLYKNLATEAEHNLIFDVKAKYFNYLKMLDKQKINEEAVKRGEEQLKLATSKYEVGSASKSDVLKAKVQYGNDKLGLISAENNVKVERARLAYLIGIDVNTDVDFARTYKSKKYDGTEFEAMKLGFAHHPGLMASQNNLTAAKYDVRSTWGRYLPSLTLGVSRNWSNSEWSKLREFRSEDALWSISTRLSIPIFLNFDRKRDLKRAKATFNNAQSDYYYKKNLVALDIKEAYLDITRWNEALEVARENVEAAREDMSLVQEKYNLGAATILELLDAQVSLITAEKSEVEAEFDYNLSVAKLENAMGIR